MAQYVDWDAAWTAVTYSTGTDLTSVAINDEADLTSDAMDLDTKWACEISVAVVEDNTGACDGNVYVYVCRDTDGTNYEDFTADDDNDNPAMLMVIAAEQNKTRRSTGTIYASDVSSFKIAIDNDCGQQVAATAKVRYATLGSS